jgi:hypothetical protein
LVYLLKEYASEEALTRNFAALRGKERECMGLLKSLRRKRILGTGPYDEYICPAGHEKTFEELASRFLAEPPKLAQIVEAEIEAGNNATLTMIELLLKMGIHGVPGFTQYELIKADMCDMFSPEVFQTLESEFIAGNICVYGQRKPRHEFLWLYHQSEEELKTATDKLVAFREKELYKMPMTKELETQIGVIIAQSQKGATARKEGLAEWSKFTKEELETVSGYFSGFTMDEDFIALNGDVYAARETLHLMVKDKLSRYDVREWREQPVVFVTSELPGWLGGIKHVFKEAYPGYSERKLAIVVPNKVAYANFKQELFSKLLARLGIEEVSET